MRLGDQSWNFGSKFRTLFLIPHTCSPSYNNVSHLLLYYLWREYWLTCGAFSPGGLDEGEIEEPLWLGPIILMSSKGDMAELSLIWLEFWWWGVLGDVGGWWMMENGRFSLSNSSSSSSYSSSRWKHGSTYLNRTRGDVTLIKKKLFLKRVFWHQIKKLLLQKICHRNDLHTT